MNAIARTARLSTRNLLHKREKRRLSVTLRPRCNRGVPAGTAVSAAN
jgi:hypothetical protein